MSKKKNAYLSRWERESPKLSQGVAEAIGVPSPPLEHRAMMGMIEEVAKAVEFTCSFQFWRMAVLWTLSLVYSYLQQWFAGVFFQKSHSYPRCSHLSTKTNKQPICVITGATSGLGRAAAYALSSEGYFVVLAGSQEESGDAIFPSYTFFAATLCIPLKKQGIEEESSMASLAWPFFHGYLILFCVTITIPQCTQAMPPPPVVTCNTTGCILHNSYGSWGDRRECWASSVTYPTTEEELRTAVAQANQKKLKVKVVSKFSHTIPKLACPDENSVIISTAKYNSGIEVDTKSLMVTVDSGVSLRDLINKVEENGLSFVASPYWEGVSVGGLISTGSHGSSWWGRGGSVHDHVVGISLVVPAGEVEGFAKIIRLDKANSLFNAAKVSLGVLGVISKVTFSLDLGFKRSITNVFNNDSHFEDEFIDLAQMHEFSDITWYPSRHTAVYRYDDRVPLNSSGDGINDFIGFQSNLALVSSSVRASEKALETARNNNGKCIMAASVVGYKKLVANGLKNNLIFTGYPVVGRQGRMQTSGSCLYSPATSTQSTCAWDPRIKGLFFYETTAIFPASKFKGFILDVKKLRDLKPENFCGVDVYNGFLIRFIKASAAYLGQSEDSVVVDFNYYRADEASTPRMNQDVWEEVEQMAFFKYGAKPHWAKNRNVAFLGVQQKYPNFAKFVAAKKQLDPQNMFSSEWSDEVQFGKEPITKGDGCAMEGRCVCSEDRHCNPGKGYLCKPGLVYGEARVCRYSTSSIA